MPDQVPVRSRPYWHADAKWVSGLLLLVSLSLTLAAYCLVQVTAEAPAVDALSMALAVALSSKGLDDPTEIAAIRPQVLSTPGGVPLAPGLRVFITADDLAKSSPRAIRLAFFRKLAEPIYRDGAAGLAALAETPEMRQTLAESAGPLNVLTSATHQRLQGLLAPLGALSLLLLAALIGFSHRFGRLASPGCLFVLVALPGLGVLTVLTHGSGNAAALLPPAQGDATMLLGYLAQLLLPPLGRLVMPVYQLLALVGAGLLTVALLGSLIYRLTRR